MSYTPDQQHAADVILSDAQFLAELKGARTEAAAREFVLKWMPSMQHISALQLEANRLGEANVANLRSLHTYISTNLAGDPRLAAIEQAHATLATAFSLPDDLGG